MQPVSGGIPFDCFPTGHTADMQEQAGSRASPNVECFFGCPRIDGNKDRLTGLRVCPGIGKAPHVLLCKNC